MVTPGHVGMLRHYGGLLIYLVMSHYVWLLHYINYVKHCLKIDKKNTGNVNAGFGFEFFNWYIGIQININGVSVDTYKAALALSGWQTNQTNQQLQQ